jgi:transposase
VARSTWQVRDKLWQAVSPLLPERPPGPRGGRPRVDGRVSVNAIVFVLFTEIAWRHPPTEIGCSPVTAQALAE